MVTLQMLGGRKEKDPSRRRARRADGGQGRHTPVLREEVGKITITDQATYVAVAREYAADALHNSSPQASRVAQSRRDRWKPDSPKAAPLIAAPASPGGDQLARITSVSARLRSSL